MSDNENRVATGPSEHKKKRAVILVVCLVAALLVGSYLGLCTWVSSSGTILPRVAAAGVDLSGLTPIQAEQLLGEQIAQRFDGQKVSLLYRDTRGADATIDIPGDAVTLDAQAVAAAAFSIGRSGHFLTGGATLISSLAVGREVPAPLLFSDASQAELTRLLARLTAELDCRPVTQSAITETDIALLVEKGEPGRSLDLDALKAQILGVFSENGPSLLVEPEIQLPDEPDFGAFARAVETAPADAYLDPETLEIVPHITGVSLDSMAAQDLYEHTGWGSLCEIDFLLSPPAVTTDLLHATLFQDIIGQASSRVGGTANRRSNVALSASACSDIILMPGDVFSYNDTTGSRTTAAGYLPAPAYVQGLSVDEIGGGICQTSSTIYYATLNGNLKIVERYNHSFAVGYVPDGMDATVYYGVLDFKFENDTGHPLKLVCETYHQSGSYYLTVTLYGTKSSTNYVKMTNEHLSSTPWQTVYRPDASIPVGTLKEEVTPYTGLKVNVYRNIYAEDGTLISQTLESVNTYRKRDRVYLFNPADAGRYQVDPVTGLPVSGVVTTPQPSPDPAQTPDPVPPSPPPSEPEPTPPGETTPPDDAPPDWLFPAPTPDQTQAPAADPETGEEAPTE